MAYNKPLYKFICLLLLYLLYVSSS